MPLGPAARDAGHDRAGAEQPEGHDAARDHERQSVRARECGDRGEHARLRRFGRLGGVGR